MDSPGYMTCALKVDTQTKGWHKSLTRLLTSIIGVTYSIDAQHGIAYVSGKIDPDKLLRRLQESEKHAELHWVDSGSHTANSPRMPFNGFMYHSYDHPYDPSFSAYACSYPYAIKAPSPWYSYPEPNALYPAPIIPFYEPRSPQRFPQPPAPQDDFNAGDPQWCSIM